MTRSINKEETLSKLAVYMFLQKFYSEQLNRISKPTWHNLITFLKEETEIFKEEKIKHGLKLLSQFTDNDLLELEYDFNRLFVGPNKLEASPYESSYLNMEKAVMQSETLAVRRFYEMVGLEVANKNVDPDDHLALELEFICYLLEHSFDDDQFTLLYEKFLVRHLFKWIEAHVELVREKTTNTIIIGISYLMEGLILEEKRTIDK